MALKRVFSALDESVEGDFGGIRNKAEHGAVKVAPGGGHDAVGQPASELDALAVDFAVVGAREVDALKAAGGAGRGGAHGLNRYVAVASNPHHVAGRNFVHFVSRYAKCGLDYGALRGDYGHFVVHEVEGGANPVRVAHQEGVALADDSAHGVSTVPVAASFLEHTRKV